MSEDIQLFFGPDWVREDVGYRRAARVYVDGELFLDTDQFTDAYDAIQYCVETFGIGNYVCETL